jgi:hypothetical protein
MQERPRDDDQPPTQPVPIQPIEPAQPAYGYIPGYIPPAPPQKPKPPARTVLTMTGAAVALLLIGGFIGAGIEKSSNGDTTKSSATTALETPAPADSGMLTPGSQISAVQAVPLLPDSSAPASTAPAVPEQVTYSCTGSAPDGVDITYGPDGSDHSASRLPFTHTDPLSQGAQYYVTTAQLQGGGNVSCSTVVQTDNLDGTADQVRKDASADGGYNIATAQVCSSFTGWDPC